MHISYQNCTFPQVRDCKYCTGHQQERKVYYLDQSQSISSWKWIDFGPDNKLYVPVGAPCNICNPSLEEKYNFDKRYASIMRLNDGEWEYVARGVRNTVGFDWHPETNNLYFGAPK